MQQRFGQRFVRRQVQVGEEQLAGAQQGIFRGLRFLDLDNQVGPLKHRGMIVHQLCAGLFVIVVRVTGPGPGAAFDEDLVPALDELISRRRQQRDAILLVFDFFGNADGHGGG